MLNIQGQVGTLVEAFAGFNTKEGFVQNFDKNSFGSEYWNLVSVADSFRWIPTVPHMFHQACKLYIGTLLEAFAGI